MRIYKSSKKKKNLIRKMIFSIIQSFKKWISREGRNPVFFKEAKYHHLPLYLQREKKGDYFW